MVLYSSPRNSQSSDSTISEQSILLGKQSIQSPRTLNIKEGRKEGILVDGAEDRRQSAWRRMMTAMLMGYIDISVYFDFSLYCYLALDRNRIPFYSILSNHIGLVTSLLAKGLPPLTAIPYRPSPPVLSLYLPLQSVDPRPILTLGWARSQKQISNCVAYKINAPTGFRVPQDFHAFSKNQKRLH